MEKSTHTNISAYTSIKYHWKHKKKWTTLVIIFGVWDYGTEVNGKQCHTFWIITHVTLIPSKKWIQLNILKNLSNTQNIPLPQPPTTYELMKLTEIPKTPLILTSPPQLCGCNPASVYWAMVGGLQSGLCITSLTIKNTPNSTAKFLSLRRLALPRSHRSL